MGKSQGDQQVTTNTKFPSWYTDVAKTAMDQARAASANLAQPYQGNTVAGLDPIQRQAIAATGANVGSTNAGYGAAQAGAARAMNYNPMMVGSNFNPMNVSGGSFLQGNIGAYMNPYIQNVEQASLGNMDRAYRQNLNTISDSAIGANAFGGSRQGVAEGVAAAENARQMGDLSAQLRSQGYGQAAGMMEQDMARNMQAQLANQSMGYNAAQLGQQAALANQNAGLQGAQFNLEAANQLGALTGQGQQAYLQGLQQAMSAGGMNRDYEQALLNQDINRYDAMSNIPQNQLNILLAALGGTQVPTSTTQRTPTSGNFLTGAAGGALAGAPFGPLGMLGGGLLGGIAGA